MSSSTTESAAATEQVLMPKMGISVSEGTISVWTKDPGDQVDDGETICEVTTDKVDVEIPAPAAGRLTKLLAEVGETVASGEPIAEIAVGDGAGEVAKPADDSPESVATSPGLAEADRDGDAAGAPGATPDRVPRGEPGRVTASGEVDRSGFLSPVVRRIAARHSIDLGGVRGSGIGGRIRKRDLLSHVAARPKQQRALHSESPYRPEPEAEPSRAKPASTPAAPNGAASNGDPTLLERPGDRREPMSAMRKTIARRMVESRRTSAHCTTIVEVDMSQVVAARRQLREGMAERGVGLTYLAFVARAVTEALGEFPQLNASVEGEEIILHSGVDMGIAVAVEKGLIVPVIRDAQQLGLEGLAAAIGELAVKARSGQLEPDDVAAGTFTITNPGQFGAVIATPIINQPQVAILDLEAVVKRAVVVTGADGDSIAIRPMTYLPMSWDHRALDGAIAARFLRTVKGRLEGGAW